MLINFGQRQVGFDGGRYRQVDQKGVAPPNVPDHLLEPGAIFGQRYRIFIKIIGRYLRGNGGYLVGNSVQIKTQFGRISFVQAPGARLFSQKINQENKRGTLTPPVVEALDERIVGM